DPEAERGAGDEEADHHRGADSQVRESDDAVRDELDQLPERILRLAGKAALPLVRDADLAEADPGEEPADVAVVLAHAPELLERAPVDEPEVARVERDVDVDEAAQGAVEDRDRRPAQPRLGRAVLPDRIDDLVALAPARDQLRHHLR